MSSPSSWRRREVGHSRDKLPTGRIVLRRYIQAVVFHVRRAGNEAVSRLPHPSRELPTSVSWIEDNEQSRDSGW